jgi:hypothetical protein
VVRVVLRAFGGKKQLGQAFAGYIVAFLRLRERLCQLACVVT